MRPYTSHPPSHFPVIQHPGSRSKLQHRLPKLFEYDYVAARSLVLSVPYRFFLRGLVCRRAACRLSSLIQAGLVLLQGTPQRSPAVHTYILHSNTAMRTAEQVVHIPMCISSKVSREETTYPGARGKFTRCKLRSVGFEFPPRPFLFFPPRLWCGPAALGFLHILCPCLDACFRHLPQQSGSSVPGEGERQSR